MGAQFQKESGTAPPDCKKSHRLINHTPDSIRRLPLHPLGGVGIGVQCEPRAVMAQGVGQGFHIHSVLQRQRGKRMPKLVEAENEGILVEVENGT